MIINQGKPCHRSNYTAGRGGNHIRYIVIHFTANNGDTAQNNCTYFGGASRGASAHYFVGDDGIYQSVKDNDRAWHCGGTTKYKHPHCRNMNSIGIEMCSRKDQNGQYYIKDNIISDTVELTRFLMDKYNIPIENVIRHYDVWSKQCPEPFVRNTKLWTDFKSRLIEEDFDMSLLKDLADKYGEDAVKSAVESVIVARKDDAWKVQGSDYLHANCDFSDVHCHDEPVTFGVLGTILSKLRK